MALELKGLAANMMRLRGTVERLNVKSSAAADKGELLEVHLKNLETQIANHIDDIEFTANTLGNSSGR